MVRELASGEPGSAPQSRAVRPAADLDQALHGTLSLEPSARRLSRLVEFLDPTDPEGLHARLARWCESYRGDYAWVFDNPCDSIVARLFRAALIGFDVTEFLDHSLARAPIALYLFHLVRQLLDGRGFILLDGRVLALAGRSGVREFRQGRPQDVAKTQCRHVPRDAKPERCTEQPDQPHFGRTNTD